MIPENILLSDNLSKDLSDFLNKKQYSRLAVLYDENTREHCYPLLASFLPAYDVIEVASGEENKTLATASVIWQKLTDLGFDRHACLLVLGGGVLGDMGGFCAATYKRGIDFVLLPTTLLAQADASVGGKLGIDFLGYKNHIGVFQQPALTLIYTPFLKTLPASELRSGFAEVIKHALISDAALWETLSQKKLEQQDWPTLVNHSVAFKASVTQADPSEKGLRKILNAGHTIGHALESFFLVNNQKILHGEAVAAGLIAESYISMQKGLLTADTFRQIATYIFSVFGKLALDPLQFEPIIKLMLQDKKNKDNRILMALPKEGGSAVWDIEVTTSAIEQALVYYRNYQT
jgi:3-dehydroquinate synthase